MISNSRVEDQWIAIQHKTFLNWTNEQLSQCNRSVENLSTDLCDGVKLVALVEALQYKKLGKVFTKPSSRIQMLHNVSLALEAVEDDHVRLVNIGTDDVVGGNLKLILGLLWHLILRYQISTNKAKAPPKKLMLTWFQNTLPALPINNFTSCWSDGIVLHSLLEFCKPGLSPNWKRLSPSNKVENVRQAMQLAKEHLNIPKVISPEDFVSPDLDELSAMTYLSYFIRKNSAGYYGTLNWVCKQLKTTNISNLTTDWNDGYFLCALVQSKGGKVKGWPNVDRNNHVATCQLGINSAKAIGVEPILSAAELADSNIDHLSVMAYISKFRSAVPKIQKADSLTLNCYLLGVNVGKATTFTIKPNDNAVEESKVKVWVTGPSTSSPSEISWSNKTATCSFQPQETGNHQLFVEYDGEQIKGCPISFSVQQDISKIQVVSDQVICKVGQLHPIYISCPVDLVDSLKVRLMGPSGEQQHLNIDPTSGGLKASFKPSVPGVWKFQTYTGSLEVNSGQVEVFDPTKAFLSVPEQGAVGEEVTCSVNLRECGCTDLDAEIEHNGRKLQDVSISPMGHLHYIKFTPSSAGLHRVTATIRGEVVSGSPKSIQVGDPGSIVVSGDGLRTGTRGMESYFTVKKEGLNGKITAEVEVSGQRVAVVREDRSEDEFRFYYVPNKAGTYIINVYWENKHVAGSPFSVSVTDKGFVKLLDDLREMKDDNNRIALEYGKPTEFCFDVSKAGPGKFKAEVLSPDGKLPVEVIQTAETATVSFMALHEGDHYIHMYWQDSPVEYSPLFAYCPGRPLPVDAIQVVIFGNGAESGRATVATDFTIDGRRAGPGVPKVILRGVQAELPVDIKPLKYDRYRCTYVSNVPGGFLLYVYWSDKLVPRCPLKITITSKGDVSKVRVSGDGLNGGISGEELKIFLDTTEAGPGEVTAECHSNRQTARCDIKENAEGQYTLRILPTDSEKHVLQIRYDSQHVPGSPFILKVGDPPDPKRVKVFGPGIEHGLVYTFESGFLVDTHGAGAGQLAVKIRGPKGGFRVDMRRETQAERRINCTYSPNEPGEYIIQVRWSGVHVPGSPFTVQLVETREELERLNKRPGFTPTEETNWVAEI